jgi:hypothetical protein
MAVKQYRFDYIDFSYADAQAKMDAISDDGWVVTGSTLAHPYAFLLWERDKPGSGEGRGEDVAAPAKPPRSRPGSA